MIPPNQFQLAVQADQTKKTLTKQACSSFQRNIHLTVNSTALRVCKNSHLKLSSGVTLFLPSWCRHIFTNIRISTSTLLQESCIIHNHAVLLEHAFTKLWIDDCIHIKLKVLAYFFCKLTAPNPPERAGFQLFVPGCKKPSHLCFTCCTSCDCPCIPAKSSTLAHKLLRSLFSLNNQIQVRHYVAFTAQISRKT